MTPPSPTEGGGQEGSLLLPTRPQGPDPRRAASSGRPGAPSHGHALARRCPWQGTRPELFQPGRGVWPCTSFLHPRKGDWKCCALGVSWGPHKPAARRACWEGRWAPGSAQTASGQGLAAEIRFTLVQFLTKEANPLGRGVFILT